MSIFKLSLVCLKIRAVPHTILVEYNYLFYKYNIENDNQHTGSLT